MIFNKNMMTLDKDYYESVVINLAVKNGEIKQPEIKYSWHDFNDDKEIIKIVKRNIKEKNDRLKELEDFKMKLLQQRCFLWEIIENKITEIKSKIKKHKIWLAINGYGKEPKYSGIDIETIKSISIKTILESYGIKIERNYFKIRNENTPSCFYYKHNNSWCDFGIGNGGSVIDLVMAVEKCDVKKAIEIISKYVA